jgi:hypothetical protein
MRKQLLISTALIAVSSFIVGCGGNGTNTTVNITNANGTNTADPLATKKIEDSTAVNDAPTLTPVYKAYCAAMEKKDEAAIRKLYSADTIRSFNEQMKDQKIKTLLEFLKDDMVSEKLCEVRNEEIKGDEATAEIKAEPYPNGIRVVFVKERGEWKLTNRSPVTDRKAETPPEANAEKN